MPHTSDWKRYNRSAQGYSVTQASGNLCPSWQASSQPGFIEANIFDMSLSTSMVQQQPDLGCQGHLDDQSTQGSKIQELFELQGSWSDLELGILLTSLGGAITNVSHSPNYLGCSDLISQLLVSSHLTAMKLQMMIQAKDQNLTSYLELTSGSLEMKYSSLNALYQAG